MLVELILEGIQLFGIIDVTLLIGILSYEFFQRIYSLLLQLIIEIISGGFDNCPKLLSIAWQNLADNASNFPAYYETVVASRKTAGKCLYCGGDFKLISKTCKLCGKKKDY